MPDFKDKIKLILEKEGDMRGETVVEHLEFIKEKEGEEAVIRVKNFLKDIGNPVDFEKIESLGWTKISIGTAITMIGKELFSWTDDDLIDLGRYIAKTTTINKLFLRHFVSIDSLLEKVNTYWKKTSKVGELKITERKENQVRLILEGYDYHKNDCLVMIGYIETIFNLCVDKEVEVKEEKCIYKGDDFHQFLVKW